MPGNVKLGSASGPDPDPTPYLYVSAETKRADHNKPYDPKKSVWVPNDEGGFIEGLLQADDGKKATVMIGHEKKVAKSETVAQVNPPKFEKCEDMADLTYLNEASVLWNLKARYQANLIYVIIFLDYIQFRYFSSSRFMFFFIYSINLGNFVIFFRFRNFRQFC